MSDPTEALILNLLEWLGPAARPYAETMEAWRTSCPRLTIWEDANERGFIALRDAADGGMSVTVSALGRAHLETHRGSRVR